jgi:hypothetical protein
VPESHPTSRWSFDDMTAATRKEVVNLTLSFGVCSLSGAGAASVAWL